MDGSNLKTKVFSFTGTQSSDCPELYVQSSVHGAEIQGYLVSLKLIEYFNKYPPKGNVTIIPLANPYGANIKMGTYTYGRFDPATGENWNRFYCDISCLRKINRVHEDQIVLEEFFSEYQNLSLAQLKKKYKEKISHSLEKLLNTPLSFSRKLNIQLQKISSSADIVLDLHCDTDSLPHIYAPEFGVVDAVKLNFPFIIAIPEVFSGAMDEATFMPWVHFYHGLKLFMPSTYSQEENHFRSFTLELGPEEIICATQADIQFNNIINFLGEMNVCSLQNEADPKKIFYEKSQVCLLENFKTIFAPCGGAIVHSTALGRSMNANDSLFTLSQLTSACGDAKTIHHLTEVTHNTPCIPVTKLKTGIALEGMPIMKVIEV